jgi:hypothetical protein
MKKTLIMLIAILTLALFFSCSIASPVAPAEANEQETDFILASVNRSSMAGMDCIGEGYRLVVTSTRIDEDIRTSWFPSADTARLTGTVTLQTSSDKSTRTMDMDLVFTIDGTEHTVKGSVTGNGSDMGYYEYNHGQVVTFEIDGKLVSYQLQDGSD